jgi:hypothetical protein
VLPAGVRDFARVVIFDPTEEPPVAASYQSIAKPVPGEETVKFPDPGVQMRLLLPPLGTVGRALTVPEV